MARFNEILAGRYNRALEKLLSMKGPPPAPQLASEIMAVLPMFWGAEMRYLEGWNRFGMTQSQAAVAANFSEIQIRNPPTSGVIAIVERAVASGPLADTVFLLVQKTNTDLTTVFSQVAGIGRLDSRGSQNSSMIFSKTAGALTSLANLQGNFPANAFFDFIATDIQEISLLPGDAVLIQSNTANQALFTSWIWRERVLEVSELT